MSTFKKQLLNTTIACGAIVALPSQAFAQDATNAPVKPTGQPAQTSAPDESTGPEASSTAPAPVANSAQESSADEIVVTGTLIPRRTTSETPSPVTVLSQESLDQRGINTVSEALQRLSSNGSGTIGEGWNNGNNFAAGASAVALRGLTVAKTLSIFDGMRMAPYPIADDGHRNFVDISTIPDNVVDRIEVLRDGASSTYGADAVAGVVNIITKKEIQGFHANASFGRSGRGDGNEYRVDLSGGYGDLDSQGFNLFVAGTYRKNDKIWARDRGFPFNTGLYSKICNDDGSCIGNPSRWSVLVMNNDGSRGGSGTPLAPMVARANAGGTRLDQYELLNSDCGAFNSFANTLPNSGRGLNTTTGLYTYAPNVCSADMKDVYATIRPDTERYGLTSRATVNIGERAQAYVQGNFFHTGTDTQLPPSAYNSTTTPPDSVTFFPLLPVYVCPTGVATIGANGVPVFSGCTNADGTPRTGAVLNPNNPYAAAGQYALLNGRYDRPTSIETKVRSLRAAAGINGSFGANDDWRYSLEGTASEVRLDRTDKNWIIPQRLADVIANGTYNFIQPWQNSDAIRDYVAPDAHKRSTSSLWQVSGTLSKSLLELPGGSLGAAVGLSYRHEAIDDPSENPGNSAHPFDRYYGVNSVGAVGSRDVKSAFFEINAPVLSNLEFNGSGRFDKYSTGQKNFSPKVGFKFTPVRELALRGTFTKGFRIGSFNELFGLPTTGYATRTINCTTFAAFCAAHGNNGYATGQYSLGRTSIGNPELDPEKSRSFTLGAVFEPVRNISFTVDYFNIKVKDVISSVSAEDQDAAIAAYLTDGNTTAVPGVVVIPGIPDQQFPNARPLPGFIQYSFQNADQEQVSGLDFGMNVNQRFGGVRWSSSLEASYLINYSVTRASGTVERYDGSLSPCDYTSCSGSPKWRANWQNTLDFGRGTITSTVYYTGGYDLASVDYGGVKGDCLANVGASVVIYRDGTPVKCKVGAQWNVDLTGSFKINDKLTIYGNVLNVLDIKPKFDPSAAYSIFNYNPAWATPNIVGRYFRLGAKVDF